MTPRNAARSTGAMGARVTLSCTDIIFSPISLNERISNLIETTPIPKINSTEQNRFFSNKLQCKIICKNTIFVKIFAIGAAEGKSCRELSLKLSSFCMGAFPKDIPTKA